MTDTKKHICIVLSSKLSCGLCIQHGFQRNIYIKMTTLSTDSKTHPLFFFYNNLYNLRVPHLEGTHWHIQFEIIF